MSQKTPPFRKGGLGGILPRVFLVGSFFFCLPALAAAPVSPFIEGDTFQDKPEQGRTTPSIAKTVMDDYVSRLNQLQEEVRELRGLVEEQAHALSQLKQQHMQAYLDLERRLSGSSGTVGQTVPATPDEAAGNTSDEKTYDAAYALLESKQYDAAIQAFQKFLTLYPASGYVPNTHYWLGELYLIQKRLSEAAAAFSLVLQQYPTHAKFADATLKLGMVLAEMGDIQKAKQLLNQVITRYPKSSLARLAETKLQTLFP